jgi:hypothetical protein
VLRKLRLPPRHEPPRSGLVYAREGVLLAGRFWVPQGRLVRHGVAVQGPRAEEMRSAAQACRAAATGGGGYQAMRWSNWYSRVAGRARAAARSAAPIAVGRERAPSAVGCSAHRDAGGCRAPPRILRYVRHKSSPAGGKHRRHGYPSDDRSFCS